jgi:hypothetical protein
MIFHNDLISHFYFESGLRVRVDCRVCIVPRFNGIVHNQRVS